MSQEQNKDMSQYFYRASAADFMKIPGRPVAYWSKSALNDITQTLNLVGKRAVKGLDTNGSINAFFRRWFEVSVTSFKALSPDSDFWYPLAKGGEFRKWYGNHEYCINYKDDGKLLRENKANLRNKELYFREGLTWTVVSSGGFSVRYMPEGFLFDQGGSAIFCEIDDPHSIFQISASLNSILGGEVSTYICPTLNFTTGDVRKFPLVDRIEMASSAKQCIKESKDDWDENETSWDFTAPPLLSSQHLSPLIQDSYRMLLICWKNRVSKVQELEEGNNLIFIRAYGLQDELRHGVTHEKITLTCNPHYRYGGGKSEAELATLLQCDTLKELVSYAIGCMMGRYSLDKPGLILASQGETLQDYLRQIPSPRFFLDDDAILPLTDQEWFADDATNRFRDFVRIVWGDEHLQENIDFVAESLCLHAIKPKRGEAALDTIRRYLSTQFFKDHLRTYKKRPIYWLFSSGKHKAFECLVYLHRYHEGTLARMRTEYVIPLSAKLNAYAEKLEKDKDNSSSAAETKSLEKEIDTLHKQQAELAEFDEKLRHYADQRISLDLDDGVKVNYGKFGDLLAEVKAVTGEAPE